MALTRVSGRVVYPHGEDTPTPVAGDGVIEYVHASPGVIGAAVHGPDRHRIEYTGGVAGEAWLKAGMWRAHVYPSEGRSYTLHLGIPEDGDVTLADVVGEVVPDGIVTKGDPGEPGEPGHTPEITFDGTTIVVDGTPGPDLKGDPGEGGGGIAGTVPIFATLAEAQAWEAENPGKTALTLEGQEPAPPNEPPIPGFLQVLPSDVSATLTVIGASDAEGAVEYAFRVDAGAWSEWQSAPSFTATGLTRDTDYSFQHRVRDAGGNVVEGVAVQARTLTEAPIPYDMAAKSLNPAFYLPGDGVVNEGWGSTDLIQSRNASQSGAALAGWSDSRRITTDGYDRFSTMEPMPDNSPQQPFGAAVVIHFDNYLANHPREGVVTLGGRYGDRAVLAGKEASHTTEWDIRVGSLGSNKVVAGPLSSETPYTGTHVFGIDCDATTSTYYADGVAVHTSPAPPSWSGYRSGVYVFREATGAIEWRGFVIDEAPLGPSVHADLAVAAGVA